MSATLNKDFVEFLLSVDTAEQRTIEWLDAIAKLFVVIRLLAHICIVALLVGTGQ